MPTPDDASPVHASGPDPDRVLLIGAGGAAGYGVLTHDLGLGGRLARAISMITGRGVDVELLVAGRLTARQAAEQLLARRPASMDAVVIALGSVEAMDGDATSSWCAQLTVLLNLLSEWCAPSRVTVIGVFPPSSVAWFPAIFERAIARNAAELNRVTREVTSAVGAHFMDFRPTPEPFVDAAGKSLYEEWARALAPTIAATIPAHARDANPAMREVLRAESANTVSLDADPRLDSITEAARRLFGTGSAAVTILGSYEQRVKSASGISSEPIPRDEAICNVTIQRSRALVIENLPTHPAFRRLAWVTGPEALRFYAGYPIESSDGHRVGALCVMDTEPHRFSRRDAALLRELAFQAQQLINAEPVA